MIAEVSTTPQLPELPIEERQRLEQRGSEIERSAAAVTIATATDYDTACSLYKDLEAAEKQAGALVAPSVEAARTAKDAAAESFRVAKALADTLVGPFTRARQALKQKLGAWREQEKAAAEAQARAAIEAATKLAEEEALARAVLLEQGGQKAAAETALEVRALPVVVAAVPPPARGISIPKCWNAKVEDLEALVRWALQDWPNRGKYVTPNERLLNQEAKARKVEDLGIPGVRGVWRHS